MKLGQTSLVFFVSRLLGSFFGFLATIYFARKLGAESLGIYYLVIGLVSWLAIIGEIGISSAVAKRVSEGEETGEYIAAGSILVGALFIITSISVIVTSERIDNYIGYAATGYIVLILLVTLSNSIIASLFSGFHLVHIKGILTPIRTGCRGLLQIGALIAGLGLTGLFLGYVIGYLFVILLGVAIVSKQLRSVSLPTKRHFQSLFDYAKFSWLGNLQSRMFNYTDVIVLGFFVPSALIGVYSIAWNIAQFLILFAGAISATFFPEISKISAEKDLQSVSGLVEDTLSYAGLLLIPGFVGGTIIGDRLLRVYGEDFTQGTIVLSILIIANLIMGYQKQILNTLNAIDRPDLSFRVNALFIVANVTLNIVLVYTYGMSGAAIATALSVTVSLFFAYYYLQAIIDFTLPYTEIAYQWIAAIFMGIVIHMLHRVQDTQYLFDRNVIAVIIFVCIGAVTYFAALYVISKDFREVVLRNIDSLP